MLPGQMLWSQLLSVVYVPRTLCLKFDPNQVNNRYCCLRVCGGGGWCVNLLVFRLSLSLAEQYFLCTYLRHMPTIWEYFRNNKQMNKLKHICLSILCPNPSFTSWGIKFVLIEQTNLSQNCNQWLRCSPNSNVVLLVTILERIPGSHYNDET